MCKNYNKKENFEYKSCTDCMKINCDNCIEKECNICNCDKKCACKNKFDKCNCLRQIIHTKEKGNYVHKFWKINANANDDANDDAKPEKRRSLLCISNVLVRNKNKFKTAKQAVFFL